MAKKSSKEAQAAKNVALEGSPKLTLNLPIDARKAAAIQRCLEKGKLTITINKIDLATGRLADGYLYD
jgi:hypothetical protein